MADNFDTGKAHDSAEDNLNRVVDLLRKHDLVTRLVHKQDTPRRDLVENLVHKQNLAELHTLLDEMHSADVARVLEALPLNDRLLVWDLVKAERDGEILLEVSDAVRESLIKAMDSDELLAAAETLDTDEIADLAPDLPKDVIQDLLESLDTQKRLRLQSAMSYPEDTVGGLMDYDMVTIRADVTLEVALRYLRRLGELPDQTDKLFVVDRDGALQGVMPLQRLLLKDPDAKVADIMAEEVVTFHAEDDANSAANAFERYDLVSAPVIDAQRHLVGRLTVNAMVDHIRQESDSDLLSIAGLREEEDIFASVWKSVQNRWAWLAINLITAFFASRVIGSFEGTIEKLVALAALMPIIAGIGGNSGNQTLTMIVRALALGQIHPDNAKKLFRKEIGVAAINGLIWGSVVGIFAYILYGKPALGIVMMGALTLNLLLAAIMGVAIPAFMHKIGRDPAVGSSVLLTAVTDSGGFFIFLGLAALFMPYLA